MKLSFSTLGCPNWTFEEILRNGPALGFQGVTFRALGGEPDLTKVPVFEASRRKKTRALLRKSDLEPNMLATSARMLAANPDDVELSLLSAEMHIDLAADIGCPFIRVFGGQIAAGVSHAAAVHWTAQRLRRLGNRAQNCGVTVLLETHDDCVDPVYVRRVMQATDHPSVGVLWDIGEQFRIIGRSAAETWKLIGPWTRACDLKDSVEDFSTKYGYRHVKLGEGDLPLFETLQHLVQQSYDGWLTFEWEKRWHPDIAEPEEAFPDFVDTIRHSLEAVKLRPEGTSY